MALPILKQNLILLDKNFGTLYQQLKRNRKKEKIDFFIQKTRTEWPTLVVEDEKGQFYLHSKYDPKKEAKIKATTCLESSKEKALFVFGFGLGYHLLELTHNIPQEKTIVIFEPSYSIFLTALKQVSFQELLNRGKVKFFVGDYSERLFFNLKQLMYREGFSTFDRLTLESEVSAFPDYFGKIEKALTQIQHDFREASNQFASGVNAIQEKYQFAGGQVSMLDLYSQIFERKGKEELSHLERFFLYYHQMMGLKKMKEGLAAEVS